MILQVLGILAVPLSWYAHHYWKTYLRPQKGEEGKGINMQTVFEAIKHACCTG